MVGKLLDQLIVLLISVAGHDPEAPRPLISLYAVCCHQQISLWSKSAEVQDMIDAEILWVGKRGSDKE